MRPHSADSPLIAHIMFRFGVGGLENGVVNLINSMPPNAYRHAVVALTDVTDEMAARVKRGDVEYYSLRKGPGHGVALYPSLYRLFRRIRPAVVHTRNLAALEMAVPAWAAGVPVRVHGEHGRDMEDLDGSVRKYQWLRRAYRPFVTRYVPMSRDLENYLRDKVGVPKERISQIYNGVDTARFRPAQGDAAELPDFPFKRGRHWVVGTVGRMQAVKHQTALARAFVHALRLAPAAAERLRLVIAGDGPLRAQVEQILGEAGLMELAWLPGERRDVPQIMRTMDCFVLPSLAEGISNTILEAMASGLPVIATRVGGNAELVEEGVTGILIAPDDEEALARRLLDYSRDPALARSHGAAGRARVEARFSLEVMVDSYTQTYDHLLGIRRAEARQVDYA